MANATSTNGLAAHYSTVIGAGGWAMQTPVDAATSEATSAVYYAPGQQEQAASIATTIGVQPSQVLPVSAATPVSSITGVDVVVVIGADLAASVDDDDHRLLTLPSSGDAAARLPALLQPLAAEPERSALFLDFDGTLSAVVVDPTGARPLPGVPALLAELAATFALVAVISGRPTAFLADVLGAPPGVTLVGLYGLERALRGPAHDTWAAVIDEVVAEAEATAPEGVYVEPKGLTVTLHFRRAPEHKDWVVAFAERQHATRGLPVHQGRLERELRRRSMWTRGPWCARWWPSTTSGASRCVRWPRSATTSATCPPSPRSRRCAPPPPTAPPRRAGGGRRHREPGCGGRGCGPDGARRRRRGGAAARPGRPPPPLAPLRPAVSAERPPAGRPTSRPRYARGPRRATPSARAARAGASMDSAACNASAVPATSKGLTPSAPPPSNASSSQAPA